MKKVLLLSILIIFFIISLIGCNNQAPTKEEKSLSQKQLKKDFELQEKCGRISKEFFKNNYYDGIIKTPNGKEIYYHYRNHYNNKLNKCFIEITEDGFIGKKKELLDVNENNSLGIVRMNKEQDIKSCYVSNKECNSEGEWNILVKPYMEE
jgi:uncharacterized lipoprotein NlpE involved in copper resistance